MDGSSMKFENCMGKSKVYIGILLTMTKGVYTQTPQ